ncbi:MAG: PEP-CTERM sorting domain-containing protein [Desulfobacterales bacterium]|nr:PEP-CTERM sorting domain-containing protein [Desulfobacterales bacterium]
MRRSGIFALLLFFVLAGQAVCSPSLDSIDGAMGSSEWYGSETVEYGNSDGADYDVERLGLVISDNMLYLGIQTDYHLDGGWRTNEKRYKKDEYGNNRSRGNYFVDPGDFAFDFNGDGSYEAGIDFRMTDSGVTFTFFELNDPGDWVDPVDHPENSPYTAYVEDYKTSQDSGGGQGEFEAIIAYTDDDNRNPGDVLEAAINLDSLSDELNRLFQGTDRTLNLYWTMECGNDGLLVSETYSYNPAEPVPEPTTLVLFSLGIFGVCLVQRRRYPWPGNRDGD